VDLGSRNQEEDLVPEHEPALASWASLYEHHYRYANVSFSSAVITSGSPAIPAEPGPRKTVVVQVERRASATLQDHKLMVDQNSHSTAFVSAFDVFEAEDSRDSLAYTGGANVFSCELEADDPAGPQVEVWAAVAYVDSHGLWCYHEVANGPFLAYSGERKSLNLTLRVKIDEEKAASFTGAGLELPKGASARFPVLLEVLQESALFLDAKPFVVPDSSTLLDLGNLTTWLS
jgi:hypothetical protein